MVTVVIVDDQELVRSGLRHIIASEPDLDVVGEAGNGSDACALIRSAVPDVALIDIQMPAMDGIEVVHKLVSEEVATRLVMLTTFDLDDYVFAALSAGASGFLLKDMAAEDIVSSVRQAARGLDGLLAPSLTKRLIERHVRGHLPAPDAIPRINLLTARELDVLKQMATGLSNAEIAHRLFIEASTTKTHVARIFAKLQVRDRVQAVIMAHECGLVE